MEKFDEKGLGLLGAVVAANNGAYTELIGTGPLVLICYISGVFHPCWLSGPI